MHEILVAPFVFLDESKREPVFHRTDKMHAYISNTFSLHKLDIYANIFVVIK